MPAIGNRLSSVREQRGISAAHLAKSVGVSRQTVYAIEAGNYIPNTMVALKLARALETTVEDLFALPADLSSGELRAADALLLPGSEPLEPGQPVQLCRVDRRLIASSPSPLPWYFPASDAVVSGKTARLQKTPLHVFDTAGAFEKRVLVAGCDPGMSVLARHVQATGVELVLAHRNSSQSIALLKEGCIHVAGTHLREDAGGESNIAEIANVFARNVVTVITFAVWEEGILTARGNPKLIAGVEDLARPGVTIINREKGAGSRKLLDARLRRAGIAAHSIAGYNRTAPGHLAAAWQVHTGAADCCISTRGAAHLLGLGFVPLASERYDLVIRRSHLDLPGIQTLLDTLGRSSFRRELEHMGGYDTRPAGQRML